MYEDIIETAREPILMLDSDLRVLSANRSFYDSFQVTSQETIGNLIYDLGNRQWDIPKLRTLLEEILPKDNKFDDYEVEHILHSTSKCNKRRSDFNWCFKTQTFSGTFINQRFYHGNLFI